MNDFKKWWSETAGPDEKAAVVILTSVGFLLFLTWIAGWVLIPTITAIITGIILFFVLIIAVCAAIAVLTE